MSNVRPWKLILKYFLHKIISKSTYWFIKSKVASIIAAQQTKKEFFSKCKNKWSQRGFSSLIASILSAILTKVKNAQRTLDCPK